MGGAWAVGLRDEMEGRKVNFECEEAIVIETLALMC